MLDYPGPLTPKEKRSDFIFTMIAHVIGGALVAFMLYCFVKAFG